MINFSPKENQITQLRILPDIVDIWNIFRAVEMHLEV